MEDRLMHPFRRRARQRHAGTVDLHAGLTAMVALAVVASVSPATAQNVRPTPPTRAADGPEAPKWTVVGAQAGSAQPRAAAGRSAPADRNGDFLIGPDYVPAPELSVVHEVPAGAVRQ